MSFLKSLAPAIGSFAGNLIAPGIGGAIGGALGSSIATSGSSPTLTTPGTSQPLTSLRNIATPSLSLTGGNLSRTSPAFIPGQSPLGPTANVGPSQTTQGTISSQFRTAAPAGTPRRLDVSGGEAGTNVSFQGGTGFGSIAAPGATDPRLLEEQDVRRRLAELNPQLGEILGQIEASRGDVGGLQAETSQLGEDVRSFQQGLDIPTDLQPQADDLRALAALAAGTDVSQLEALGFDATALKDDVGNIDTAKLQEAIQLAEQLTGTALTEEGIAEFERGLAASGNVQTQGAFDSPLGALAQARGAAVSEEPAFNQLREDIGAFRETLAPQFNEALQANLQEIDAREATAAGDLRSQFAERRISGSSFAADKVTQLEGEFGRERDLTRANFFQQATTATLQAFGIESDVLNTQVGQRLSAAAQRAAFAAEEAGILNTEVGRQLEQAGIITEGGNRLAEIGLLQSEQDLNQARTIGEIARNEIDAELTKAALEGELTQLGASILSDGISQRLAAIQTGGNLTAQEANVLAQQATLAMSEAALNGDLFQIERSVLEQGAKNVALSMGLNEQQADAFTIQLLAIRDDAALIQQTTTRELQELQISGNIANGILASTADISAANADLAIRNAQAQGQAAAGFADLGQQAFSSIFAGGGGSSGSQVPSFTPLTQTNLPTTPNLGGSSAPAPGTNLFGGG